MSRLRRICFALSALTTLWRPPRIAAQSNGFLLQVDQPCMIELTLRTQDTLAVSSPLPTCGELRLIYDGPPTIVREPFKQFAIPIALENIGRRTLPTPIEVEVDSVTQVREGRQIPSFFSWGFYDIGLWEGRVMQKPWRFGPVTEPAPPAEQGGARSRLLPGRRTNSTTIGLSVAPKARTLRLWIGFRARPFRYGGDRPPIVRSPLDAPARALIAASKLPNVHDSTGIYRDSRRGFLIFEATYGEAQDCPSGCFYEGLTGISYRGRAGWLPMDAQDDFRSVGHPLDRNFEPTQEDSALFALFVDPNKPQFAGADDQIRRTLLLNLLRSPIVPRALLQSKIDPLFSEIDQFMATFLVSLPRVRHDAGLLTKLAFLPNGYEGSSASALQGLRALAPQLIRDSTTSARSMFALALSVGQAMDSALARAIADHPNARANPATLTVLGELVPSLRGRAVSSVRGASQRVRDRLEGCFVNAPASLRSQCGRDVLLDPEIRSNPDALRVLANLTHDREAYIVIEAERLLPDSDFLRWAPRYTPIP